MLGKKREKSIINKENNAVMEQSIYNFNIKLISNDLEVNFFYFIKINTIKVKYGKI